MKATKHRFEDRAWSIERVGYSYSEGRWSFIIGTNPRCYEIHVYQDGYLSFCKRALTRYGVERRISPESC
jgi:hypothetical protein